MNYQRQGFNNCGPTSVAILLGYYGHQVTQHDVNQEIPAGSLANLDAYLVQYELMTRAYRTSPSRDAVRLLLAQHVPVIANQWLTREDKEIRHYRVIRGYDDATQEFIVDDPLLGADMHITYADFIWLSSPGHILPIYPPELDPLVRTLMSELHMREAPV